MCRHNIYLSPFGQQQQTVDDGVTQREMSSKDSPCEDVVHAKTNMFQQTK